SAERSSQTGPGGEAEQAPDASPGQETGSTLGKVLRRATSEDFRKMREIRLKSCPAEEQYCRNRIRELELPMKLVHVEHLFGGEKIIFYFLADGRVDFRELVKDLAGQYHTRIEMKQIGVRDEARLLGDREHCGMTLCCQTFLKGFEPITMKMAKNQKATLDPSKISGHCGRLMCCLRYEDVCYEELRKKLPKRNTWVRTDDLVGRVMDTQILTQLARLQLPDGSTTVVDNEEIVERDVEAPAPQPQTLAAGPAGRRGESRSRRPRVGKAAVKAETPGAKEPPPGAQPEKRRRRREAGPKPAAPVPKKAAATEPKAPESDKGGQSRRRHRRRRPRGKKKGA
ncbi:MAG: stage 0 sporulation protein, partial [Candidatus Brocadiae bacterium]|nr:stage 0 sporulation protein [Candidatus Brocadiia bacterium]